MRPGRGTRPRSRLRPSHDEAVDGRVVTVDRGRFTVALDEPGDGPDTVGAIKARELGRRGIAVGDRVALVGDTAGGPDALARIVRLHPRTSVLRRTADDDDPIERVLVANAEQLVIVAALAEPATAAPADRPVPGGRLRRRAHPAALPDQVRPRVRRRGARPLCRAGCRARGDPAGPGPGCAARAPGGPGQRAGRYLRGRKVHAGEHPGPRHRPRGRSGERRHRPRPAHLEFRGGVGAARPAAG